MYVEANGTRLFVDMEGPGLVTVPPCVTNPCWSYSMTARQGAGVAEAWAREVEGKPEVAAELRAFAEAAGRRLGEDGMRDLVRSARGAQDGPGQREGLAGIGRALAVSGEEQQARASAQERAREIEREQLGRLLGR